MPRLVAALQVAALLVAGLLAAAVAGGAQAGTLERVRAAGELRCGAAPRAGFADAGEDGHVRGLALDLCRALTIAVLGPRGRAALRLYESARDFDGVRDGHDAVALLGADSVVEHRLAASVIPGPVVFIAEETVLVQPGVSGLDGRAVCFMNGSPAHQALEAWAGRAGIAFVRSGFQELGEMHDAYDAHRCDAMADEATELAEFQAQSNARAGGIARPALGLVPVFAATPAGDGAWASTVAWAMAAIVQSETTPSPWRGDPPGAALPGLAPGWLDAVRAVLGSYPEMRDRALHVGPAGGRAAAGGPNALWPEGALLPPGPR